MKDKKDPNLELLERQANHVSLLNKYLRKKLDLYQKYTKLTKNAMTKCFTDQDNYIGVFNTYINEIQKDYDIMKDDYDKKYFPKYESLTDNYFSDISMGKPILNQCQNEEFSLGYLKTKSEDIVNELKKDIKQSKHFNLFREPKRDSLVDILQGNKEIEKVTNELQQNMLYECKKCNKFKYRVKKYSAQISAMKKNINILKKYLKGQKIEDKNEDISSHNKEENNNTPSIKNTENKMKFNMGRVDLKQSVNIGFLNPSFGKKKGKNKDSNKNNEMQGGGSSDRLKKKNSGGINTKKTFRKQKPIIRRKTNKIISQFKKVEDLFEISSEEGENEQIIDEEFHSDDENIFENKIKLKRQLKINYFDKIKQNVPDINLGQIEYNKLKIMGEADRYSLERRKFKTKNVKELKKNIEKLKEKKDLLVQKEKVMKEYINKCKEKYNVLKPMKVQTSVYKKEVDFIKKSLFGGDNIKEELDEGGEVGSDYENEENEKSEEEIKNKFNYKDKDLRISVFVGKPPENSNKRLKHSMKDEMFKNKLRDKLRDRANSK
jgi:hypothetical protein